MVKNTERSRYEDQHLKALHEIARMLDNVNISLERIADKMEAKL